MFKFEKTNIEGLVVVEPPVFIDERGVLKKSFEKKIFQENGINLTAMEEIETTSRKGVLRGLHLQTSCSQAKLVRVAKGAIYDVAVDLRKGSRTFGKWFGIRLTEENRKMLYIPEGFAHGCLILEEGTTFYYLCSQGYCPGFDTGIIWDDQILNIDWPVDEAGQVILSDKDRQLDTFAGYKEKYCSREGQNEGNYNCDTYL